MSLSSKIHLRPNEEIIEVVRRSPITLFWKYFLGLVPMVAASFFMFWLLSRGWWGCLIYCLGIFLGIFYIFRAWFFGRKNILVITNERAVDISRVGWFDEIISSVGYADVKDFFVRKKGVMSNIFDYGSLIIETKSKQTVLEAEKIKRPQVIHAIIADAADEFRRGRREFTRQAVYSEFLKIIGGLSEKEICEVKSLLQDRLQNLGSVEIVGDKMVQ